MLFKNVKYVHSFGKKRLSLNFWSYWEQEEHNLTIAEIKKSEEQYHYQTPRRGSSIVTLARLKSKWSRASQQNVRFGVKTDYSYFYPRFSARWFLHAVVSLQKGWYSTASEISPNREVLGLPCSYSTSGG